MIDTNALELIQKVDSFYNTSWQHLIYLTSALLTVGLVLVPFLVQWAQYRIFKSEEQNLKARLDEHINDKIKSTRQDLETSLKTSFQASTDKFSQELKDIRKLVANTEAQALGSTYHVQALLNLSDKMYVSAAASSINAIRRYIEADDQGNLLVVTRHILQVSLKNLTHKLIEDIKPTEDLDTGIAELVALLEKHNHKGRYTLEIIDIQSELKAAHKRNNPP